MHPIKSEWQVQQPTVYTVQEFAEKYKLHPKSVLRLIRQKKIPGARKIGHSWRIEQ